VGVVAARSKHAAMQIDEARTDETALALPWLALRNECRVSKGGRRGNARPSPHDEPDDDPVGKAKPVC